jgi:hypothetical protein
VEAVPVGDNKESDPQMQLAYCDQLNVQRWQNICSHNGDWLLVQIALTNGKNLSFTLSRSMVPEIRDYFDQSSKQLEHNKQVSAQHLQTRS